MVLPQMPAPTVRPVPKPCARCRRIFRAHPRECYCGTCRPLHQAEAYQQRLATKRERNAIRLVGDCGDWRDPAIFGELERLIAEEVKEA